MHIPTLAAIADIKLSAADKGLPARAGGMTIRDFLASQPTLDEFWTPLLVLDRENLSRNIGALAGWCANAGFELMPHGKTSMSPQLWAEQLAAGATGITLATMGQVRVAREFGFDSILLANELTDPLAVQYIAAELNNSGLEFLCWVDSVEGVAALEQALEGIELRRPINVCVELGAAHGRTGARSVAEGVAIGRRLAAAPKVRLAGVGGYEGALAHDRSPAEVAAVRAFLRAQLELHSALKEFYDSEPAIVTVGGSAYFDLVAEEFAEAMAADRRTRWVLRSGSYVTHDDGYYREVSPLADTGADSGPRSGTLRAAMHGMARVLSNPEPGLALLDGGKRDFAHDWGLPIPMGRAAGLGQAMEPLAGAKVTAVNDQHAFVEFDPATALPVGSVVQLGLSHPCTAFDKWRFIPVVEQPGSNRVVDLLPTYF